MLRPMSHDPDLITIFRGIGNPPRAEKRRFRPSPQTSPPMAARGRRQPSADELPVSFGAVRAAGGQLICELEPGVWIDTNPAAAQDVNGVDITLVDRTLALSPDDRVRHLDAWINSVRRLRAEIDAERSDH